MKTLEAKATNAAGERSDVAPIATDLKLKGREVNCAECHSPVSVVALPGDGGMRIGWHRVVDSSVTAVERPVYRSCPGSWARLVTP